MAGARKAAAAVAPAAAAPSTPVLPTADAAASASAPVDPTASAADAASGEEPKVAAPPKPPPKPPNALDQLAEGTDRPDWATTLLADMDARGDDYAVDQDTLRSLPIEAQQALAVLLRRADKAREKKAAADAAEAARETRAAAREREAAGLEERSLEWAGHPDLKAFRDKLRPPAGDQPDPFSPEGVAWLVQNKVADALDDFFGVISGVQEARSTEAAMASKVEALAKRKEEIKAYRQANTADFDNPEIKARIVAELEASGVDSDTKLYRMPVKRAHQIVMAELALEAQGTEREDALAKARSRVAPGGRQGRPTPSMPKDMSSQEQAEWLESHPEARKAIIDMHLRKRT